ncbi:hypothetical protein [Psychrobacillus sp. NPDC096389]|uniref:hypothetical protein n=1 Tax=Psychrobacillus sp. NPDC096389 TaxID=3364490 RepID=UPI00380ABB28
MYKVLGFVAVMSLFLIDTVIIGYVAKVYFVESETIIAGCIAFVGAVIGGAITLLGVNKTIQDSRRKEELQKIPLKLKLIEDISVFLGEVYKNSYISEEVDIEIKKFISETYDMFNDTSLEIDIMILGKDMLESFNEIHKWISVCRLNSFTKAPFKSGVVHTELKEKIMLCLNLIDKKKIELTNQYYNL